MTMLTTGYKNHYIHFNDNKITVQIMHKDGGFRLNDSIKSEKHAKQTISRIVNKKLDWIN